MYCTMCTNNGSQTTTRHMIHDDLSNMWCRIRPDLPLVSTKSFQRRERTYVQRRERTYVRTRWQQKTARSTTTASHTQHTISLDAASARFHYPLPSRTKQDKKKQQAHSRIDGKDETNTGKKRQKRGTSTTTAVQVVHTIYYMGDVKLQIKRKGNQQQGHHECST